MTAVTTEVSRQVAETLALHAYIVDEDQLERLGELFVPDAVYDMSAAGMGVFEGIDVIGAAASRLSASGHAPLAHFVTNIVVEAVDGEPAIVSAHSRGLMIMNDGLAHAVNYADELRHHNGRWLIARRVITPVQRLGAVRPQ